MITPPFVPNSPDDLHCLQAAYKMILLGFEPDAVIDDADWDRITGFETDKGTWASAGLLWFSERGYSVEHHTLFDYNDFALHGGEYLMRLTGPDVSSWQINHSNIPLEQERARQLVASGIAKFREPTITDIQKYLDAGYLVRVLINSRRLADLSGYVGHAVTIFSYTQKEVILHDPGLPAIESREVSWEAFEAAWADPNRESKEMDVIRLDNVQQTKSR